MSTENKPESTIEKKQEAFKHEYADELLKQEVKLWKERFESSVKDIQSLRDQLAAKETIITDYSKWHSYNMQKIESLEIENRKLKEWKKNHERLGIKLGTSISAFILQLLKDRNP